MQALSRAVANVVPVYCMPVCSQFPLWLQHACAMRWEGIMLPVASVTAGVSSTGPSVPEQSSPACLQDAGLGGQVYDRNTIEKMVGKGDDMFSGEQAPLVLKPARAACDACAAPACAEVPQKCSCQPGMTLACLLRSAWGATGLPMWEWGCAMRCRR